MRNDKPVDTGTRQHFQPSFNAGPLCSTRKSRNPLTRHVQDALACKTVARPMDGVDGEKMAKSSSVEVERREMPSVVLL